MERLEALLHPAIAARLNEELHNCHGPYAVVAVPLLIECGAQHCFHRVLVTDAKPSVQIKRLCLRDHIDEAAASSMLKSQVSPERRRLEATDLICTDRLTLSELRALGLKLHDKYCQIVNLAGVAVPDAHIRFSPEPQGPQLP
mgnify:FL=1